MIVSVLSVEEKLDDRDEVVNTIECHTGSVDDCDHDRQKHADHQDQVLMVHNEEGLDIVQGLRHCHEDFAEYTETF